MKRHYAGVGSRETPPDVLNLMWRLAGLLAGSHVLRSGAADGADTAFETGALDRRGTVEIYLPWKGFNGNASPLYDVTPEAMRMASTAHPRWEHLGQGPQKLHARNCYQVLGQDLKTPGEFVLCWTADGCESAKTRRQGTGGTATAIVLAERHGIPVFNLCNPASRKRLVEHLGAQGLDCSWLMPSGLQESLF